MTFTLVAVAAASACTTTEEDTVWPDWVDGKADGASQLAFTKVTSKAQFEALALADGGVVIQGPSMKFVIDRRKPTSPKIFFQNANFKRDGKTPNSARYHFYFSEEVLKDFEEDLETFNNST